MNHKGCAASEALSYPGVFCAGYTTDVVAALHVGGQLADNAAAAPLPLVLVGFSLGANISVLTLCDERHADVTKRVDALVTLGNPADLHRSCAHIHGGDLSGPSACSPGGVRGLMRRLYVGALTHSLRSLVHRSKATFANHPKSPLSNQSVAAATNARHICEFDAAVVVSAFRFHDLRAYYKGCSSLPHLSHLRVPHLSITAADDPVCCPLLVSEAAAAAAATPRSLFVQSMQGGHLGFPERSPGALFGCWDPLFGPSWGDALSLRWMAHVTRDVRRAPTPR